MHAALELIRLCLSYFARETRSDCYQLAPLSPPMLPLHACWRDFGPLLACHNGDGGTVRGCSTNSPRPKRWLLAGDNPRQFYEDQVNVTPRS
jgi:hypothetical protein